MPNTSLRRLTTKTLPKIQVNDWRRKFYKSDTAKGNSSPRSVWHTPREIPHKVRWKFNKGNSATKVQAALLFDGNPATGPTNTVWRRKHLLQFATNSVLLQLYPIHIFTSQYTNTTRDGRIQGERRRSGASFLQALTLLNFFKFFKNLNTTTLTIFQSWSIICQNPTAKNFYPWLGNFEDFRLSINQNQD